MGEEDSYWGYVTTSGTEGNLHGILLARECHPDGILYTSQETHYSVFKAARYYRMQCEAIPTLPMGEIDYEQLARRLEQNRDKPAIINVNIGTTVKGAVDNLDRILDILQTLNFPEDQYHIHCDGALFALMMPFVEGGSELSFEKPIIPLLSADTRCLVAQCLVELLSAARNTSKRSNNILTTSTVWTLPLWDREMDKLLCTCGTVFERRDL